MSAGEGEEGAADLSPKVIRAIERERRRLDRATALLKCLTVVSMYDDAIDAGGVAAPDARGDLYADQHPGVTPAAFIQAVGF